MNERINPWHHWGRWPENVLYTSLWFPYDTAALRHLGPYITEIRDLDGNYFFLQSELDNLYSFFKNTIQKNPTWFETFFTIADKTAQQVLSLERKTNLTDLLPAAVESLSCSKIVELLDYCLQRHIREEQQTDPGELLKGVEPFRQTQLSQYEQDLRNLDSSSKQGVMAFLEQYSWVGTHGFKGEPLTEEKLRASLAHHTPQPEAQAYKTKNEMELLVSKLMYYRSHLVETVDRATFSYWNEVKRIAYEHQLSEEDIRLFTYKELIALIKSGIKPATYLDRKTGFGITINKQGDIHVLVEKELQDLLKQSLGKSPETPQASELHGSPAYPGFVKGIVKIVKSAKDLHKLLPGDILVTHETTPDYILGMKRAAAIITDQGGITSHAAIVSRELRIPCIVGTKTATQVLQDGDTVEVNAETGTIKKLTR